LLVQFSSRFLLVLNRLPHFQSISFSYFFLILIQIRIILNIRIINIIFFINFSQILKLFRFTVLSSILFFIIIILFIIFWFITSFRMPQISILFSIFLQLLSQSTVLHFLLLHLILIMFFILFQIYQWWLNTYCLLN
jgi:hypothetical protein